MVDVTKNMILSTWMRLWVMLSESSKRQAGAELCQAQEKLGLAIPALPSKKLRWSSIWKDIQAGGASVGVNSEDHRSAEPTDTVRNLIDEWEVGGVYGGRSQGGGSYLLLDFVKYIRQLQADQTPPQLNWYEPLGMAGRSSQSEKVWRSYRMCGEGIQWGEQWEIFF